MIKAVLFDLGDTLIHERVDDAEPLDRMTLNAKPGVLAALQRLAPTFALGLVTDTESSNEVVVRRALRTLGLEHFFRAVVTSQDMGVTKPDPAMFREALRRLGAEPGETVMVGNDLDRDVTPALALGLQAILVSDSGYFDAARATPAPVVPTLAAVPDTILAMAGAGGTPPGPAGGREDVRAQYAAAVQMSVYDGQLSWQVTGLYVQFAFLLAAGAVFPSFVGTTSPVLLALAGSLIALAGLVTALMFGSMCMRIRTYEGLWAARAAQIEGTMAGPGVLAAAAELSARRVVTADGGIIRMHRWSAVKTRVMMNALFGVFVTVFLGLLVLNLVRAARAA